MNAPTAAIRTCPTHGGYIARHIMENLYTDCPVCLDELVRIWRRDFPSPGSRPAPSGPSLESVDASTAPESLHSEVPAP